LVGVIKEYKTEMKKQNVSKEIRTLNLKKALFCRVKTINERIEENDKYLLDKPKNTEYLKRKTEFEEHKMFILKYLTENILNGSPSKSKSVFSRMFSSKKAGGKTQKKGRRSRKTRKTRK
jgi:hypothetical protein